MVPYSENIRKIPGFPYTSYNIAQTHYSYLPRSLFPAKELIPMYSDFAD